MIELADEVLSLIAKKGRIKVTDIQDRLGIIKQTTSSVIDFLVKFDFAEFDPDKRYIRLTEPCRKFLEEIK